MQDACHFNQECETLSCSELEDGLREGLMELHGNGINKMVTMQIISTGIIPACSTCVHTCIHDNSFSVPGWVIALLVISVVLWVISLIEGVISIPLVIVLERKFPDNANSKLK